MKKIKRIIIGIVIIIILVILLPCILNLFTSDIDPIDDSDLKLQVILIPDEENAYFDLIKIDDVLYQPEGRKKEIIDMANNNSWNQELAEDIISNNQKALELFSLAAQKPKFQNPILSNPDNIKPNIALPPLASWKIMSEYSSIKAIYLLKQGQNEDAIEEALKSIQIAQKIQESQLTFIEYLLAMAMRERGLKNIQNIISSVDIGSNILKEHNINMNSFYGNENGFINIIKGRYGWNAMIINAIETGDVEMLQMMGWKIRDKYPKNNYYFRPNKTKKLFMEEAKSIIKNANQYCNDIQLPKNNIELSSSLIKNYLTENVNGEAMFYINKGSINPLFEKKCNEDSLISATQALIAIKAYQNDYGDLPNSLNQLVPDYMESIPLDYFDGNQLRYSKENRILYSVGADGKDEGGSTGEDWKKMPDPTFKINF